MNLYSTIVGAHPHLFQLIPIKLLIKRQNPTTTLHAALNPSLPPNPLPIPPKLPKLTPQILQLNLILFLNKYLHGFKRWLIIWGIFKYFYQWLPKVRCPTFFYYNIIAAFKLSSIRNHCAYIHPHFCHTSWWTNQKKAREWEWYD